MTKPLVCYLVTEKITTGAIKYLEVQPDFAPFPSGSDAPLRNMYLRLSHFPDGNYPKRLKVTIEFE